MTHLPLAYLSHHKMPVQSGSHSRNSESSAAVDTLCIDFYDSSGLGLKCYGKCQQHFDKCSFIVTALTYIVQTALQNGFRPICFRGNSYRPTEWGMISIILRIHNGNIKERSADWFSMSCPWDYDDSFEQRKRNTFSPKNENVFLSIVSQYNCLCL